jgi:hypothetical protein
LATIEPEEELSVTLRANPAYPDVEWQIVEFDAAVIALDASFSEVVRQEAPDDQQSLLTQWGFVFTGGDLGESPLVFEIRDDGQRVDVAEFAVAVVEDACASDVGVSAARCGKDRPDEQGLRGWTEWDHGWMVTIESVAATSVTLTANALYPDVRWQVVEYDPAVVEIQSLGTGRVRTPGDWELSDPDKPESFLPISEFMVTSVGSGESPLVLELRVGDQRVEMVEFTAVVAEDA